MRQVGEQTEAQVGLGSQGEQVRRQELEPRPALFPVWDPPSLSQPGVQQTVALVKRALQPSCRWRPSEEEAGRRRGVSQLCRRAVSNQHSSVQVALASGTDITRRGPGGEVALEGRAQTVGKWLSSEHVCAGGPSSVGEGHVSGLECPHGLGAGVRALAGLAGLVGP